MTFDIWRLECKKKHETKKDSEIEPIADNIAMYNVFRNISYLYAAWVKKRSSISVLLI